MLRHYLPVNRGVDAFAVGAGQAAPCRYRSREERRALKYNWARVGSVPRTTHFTKFAGSSVMASVT